MRTIERASAFKKDFKRVKASPRHARDIDVLLATIVAMLVVDRPLPDSNRDHALGGDWRGYRDCHVKPDLVLIYRKPDSETLRLARLGSHSELFG
jgi:mRNA interferase YafQ